MPVNSRAKGNAGELELSKKLRDLCLGDDIRRGQQYNGLDGADVVGLPGIHPECKRVERLSLQNAMNQALKDCPDDQMAAVFSRQNRTPWLVTMTLEDWATLYRHAKPSLIGEGET